MSESTKLDPASDSASSASLKEANDGRIVRDEGEMAAAGDLEAARERSIEEKESEVDGEVDPYLVTWKGADDPENPLNFPMRKKVSLMVMIAAIAFLTYLPCICSRRMEIIYQTNWFSNVFSRNS
jgi:hypothetical protein